jgi:uncharacterized membrane protein YphA (DoxX/SURF4 family)
MMDPTIDLTLRTALALLFAVAALHKLRAPGRFRAILDDYRLVPAALGPPAAVLVVAAELAVAAALLVPALRPVGGALAALLLGAYALAIGVNLARGRRDIDCGCAGPASRRTLSGGLVVRNAILAVGALATLVPCTPRALVWVDAVTVAAATLALAACWAACDRLLAEAPRLARLREPA